jgi:hypothetical protein
MKNPDVPSERLSFFDGQRLFASDLAGIDGYNRDLRWLHNRSLHQPGIGSGYAVSGPRGAREVSIGAGYALDARGREIVLTMPWVEPVPPVASEAGGQSVFFDLTVAYPDDAELPESETREGICLPRGAVRRREEPSFCWARLERGDAGDLQPVDLQQKQDIQSAMRIVLARAEVLDCRLKQAVSTVERQSARRAAQPYIACGEAPGRWSRLDLPVPAGTAVQPPFLSFGLRSDVDTSAAGFATTPAYTARIAGDRVLLDPKGLPLVLAEPVIAVRDPSPKGFALEAYLLVTDLRGSASDLTLASFDAWRVAWMGVE